MRSLLLKVLGLMASAAFTIAVTAAGAASFGGLHQPEEPKELKKYKII